MKKTFIKALALATLALSLVFTVVSTTEIPNDGITNEESTTFRRSDAPHDYEIVT